jgi:hypothetical protein
MASSTSGAGQLPFPFGEVDEGGFFFFSPAVILATSASMAF